MSIKYSLVVAMAMTMGLAGCSNSNQSTQGSTATSSDKPVVLRFSHFWPATSTVNKEIFEPWAKDIEKESNGRLKIEIYPSSTLSKADVTYDAAVKGTVDIGSQAQGYTNGRFPLTQITELPGLSNSAKQMSCMLQTLYDDGTIASEYQDSHLLFMYGLGPGALHTTKKLIEKPEDMKGLRIRRPSSVAGDIIESMGASPVGMPATDVYTSLQRGVMDGLSQPWESIRTFRIDELANYHTNIPFYSSGLMVTMNKAKYDSLPDDLKKVLDNNSGMKLAMKAGEVFDKHDKDVLNSVIAKGHKVVEIPDPLNDPAWAEPLKKGTQKYLNSVKAVGGDAEAVYAKAQEVSQKCKSS